MPTLLRRCAFVLGLMILGVPAATRADDKAPEPSIDELRVPATPALILMDVSATSVERPATPRAFAMEVLSATERSTTNWPADLAVEFAPYWWRSHPKLTFEDYYNPHKGVGATIQQTLSISIGTTDLQDQTGTPGTRAGLGLRFLLLHGRAAPELDDRVKALREEQLAALECVPDEPSAPIDEACLEKHEPKLKAAGRAVADLDKQRRGWLLEFATAVTGDFPDDNARRVSASRLGGWMTASYRGNGSLTFVGVARFLRDRSAAEDVNNVDAGARVVWTANPAVMPPLAFSAEYVYRARSAGDDTDKLVAILEYRTPLDNISLLASYGKDFANDFTGKEQMVSTLGIHFGFGRGPVIVPPK